MPGELGGETLAILVLFSFYCRVQLPDDANHVRKKILLFLTSKVYQDATPAACLHVFTHELQILLQEDQEECKIVQRYLVSMFDLLDVPDGLTRLFNEHFGKLLPSYESMGVLNTTDIFFERRSFFGLYFRRAKLIFDSLDLQGRHLLTASARAWRAGPTSDLTDVSSSSADISPGEARTQAFRNYQLGLLRGDYTLAKENMERFFDFFPPGADHEMHQHTLLHLAAFHLQSDSFVAAKAALDEAISLARTASDQECIQMCESLMDRIKGVGCSSADRSRQTRTSEDIHPPIVDAVWRARSDVKKGGSLVSVLETLSDAACPAELSQEVLSSLEASLELIEDAKKRSGINISGERSELGRLWSKVGQGAVGEIYQMQASRNAAKAAGKPELRIDSICQQAVFLAKQGRFDAALASLLVPDVYNCLSFQEYKGWCEAISDILWLRATRRGESRTLRLLQRRLPQHRKSSCNLDIEELVDAPKALLDLALHQSEFDSIAANSDLISQTLKGLAHLSSEDQIETLLRYAKSYIGGSQPSLALLPILAGLSQAKRLEYGGLTGTAQVLLAELLGLHLGMPERARVLMEDCLPSCLSSTDAEHRSNSQWTYSRLLLACSEHKSSADLDRCLWWMEQAEQNAERAECLDLQRIILYYMARLLTHKGDTSKAAELNIKLIDVENVWTQATDSVCPESLNQVEKILEVLSSVGAYVGSGMAAAARTSVM